MSYIILRNISIVVVWDFLGDDRLMTIGTGRLRSTALDTAYGMTIGLMRRQALENLRIGQLKYPLLRQTAHMGACVGTSFNWPIRRLENYGF